jgi:hypothetical protein
MSDDAVPLRRIAASFRRGVIRLLQYTRATNVLLGAFSEYRRAVERQVPWPGEQNVTLFLSKMTPEDAEVVEHLAPLTQLVYATTLLDTFLSGVTTLLLLRYPKALGKAATVSIDDLVGASSKHELLTAVVTKKTREVAGQGFVARVEYLRSTFGLPLDIPDLAWKSAAECFALRNLAVHDETDIALSWTADGITAADRGVAQGRADVTDRDVQTAVYAYRVVADEITIAIFKGVFKLDDAQLTASFRKWASTALEKLSYHVSSESL